MTEHEKQLQELAEREYPDGINHVHLLRKGFIRGLTMRLFNSAEETIKGRAGKYAESWKVDMGPFWGYTAVHYTNGFKEALSSIEVKEDDRNEAIMTE